MTSAGNDFDMVSGVEKLACAGNVCRLEGARRAGSKMGTTPPPGVFFRKDVILWELSCEMSQGCDSKGFIADWAEPGADSEVSRGLVEAITNHDSMKC
jgi:hypothetical protein